MHFVAGMDHPSSYALLVERACEAFMMCIPAENLYLILHSDKAKDNEKATEDTVSSFMKSNRTLDAGSLGGSIGSLTEPSYINTPFERSLNFLHALGIYHTSQWEGKFSSENKMIKYLKMMAHINMSDSYIYHSDLDEIPDRELLAQAFQEIRNGSCNII